MNPSTIDWPGLKYTWNPITGCRRGCEYCYARRIHERFNKTPFSDIVFHPSRLNDPIKEKKPSVIFVGSMSDIDYWKPENINQIIGICEFCHRHTLMFLSKNPLSYHEYDWPKNTMQGLTMDLTQTEHCQEENIEEMTKYHRPFLSLEPLLGFLKTETGDKFEHVIVGCDSNKGALPPRPEWIQSIRDNVPAEKIWWKHSMWPYINDNEKHNCADCADFHTNCFGIIEAIKRTPPCWKPITGNSQKGNPCTPRSHNLLKAAGETTCDICGEKL